MRLQKTKNILVSAALVFLVGAVPTLSMNGGPGGSGVAAAALRGDGGGSSRRAANTGGARAGQKSSRVDRQPRASSARQGSVRTASNARAGKPDRQAGSGGAVKRPVKPATREQRPVKRETKPASRPATTRTRQTERNLQRSDWNNKLKTHEGPKPVKRTERKADRPERTATQRRQPDAASTEARRNNVQDRRKEYTANRAEIRDDRKKSMQEWQEDRRDYLDSAREDRQDFRKDMMRDREDLWEDVYDDRRYWGDWDDWHDHDHDDDDNEWLWGIVGGVAGYMIGAAVNSPPAGTVTVPAGGTNYQYYGGAFYQPAPSGDGYVTAPAPVGASVEAPPLDCTIVFGPAPEDPGYCFFQGAFFLYDESSDSYLVAEPPVGTQVPYLPEGYTQETVGGVEYYKLGTIYYRPYLAGDDEMFVVSAI